MYRCVLIKGPMSSGCVIVARVGAQQMAQMRLAKDDDVVQAFAANGPAAICRTRYRNGAAGSVAFGKAVLPWRVRSDRFIPNAHCAEALSHDGTEDAVSVADQVPRR